VGPNIRGARGRANAPSVFFLSVVYSQGRKCAFGVRVGERFICVKFWFERIFSIFLI